MAKSCGAGVPGGDGAVQVGKDEVSGRAIPAVSYRKGRGGGVCIGDLAGGTLGTACRFWDGDKAARRVDVHLSDVCAARHRVEGCRVRNLV